MKAPMLLPLLALGLGILSFYFFGIDFLVGGASIICGAILYCALRSLRKDPVLNFRYSIWHYGWIFLAFFGVGLITADFSETKIPSEKELGYAVMAEGHVLDLSSKTYGDRLIVDVNALYDTHGEPLTIDPYKIVLYSDAVVCSIDDVILFPIDEFTRIKDSDNSFRKDYASMMARQRLYHSVAVNGNEIRIINHSTTPHGLSTGMRDKVVTLIEKSGLATRTKKFIIPLLTGDRDYLDNNTRDLFSEAGMAHVLALSGMHIGIIAGIFLGLLFPLNFLGKYKLRYFLTAILLWAYAFLTGMGSSIIRACVMTSAFIVAMLLERKNTALNSLCIAAFLILLITPDAIFEPGFQLSFVCVATLILYSPYINPIDRRHHPRIYYFFGIISATLFATFSSWIVSAYYFGGVPTMFLPSNLIVLPLLPLYVFTVLLFLILSTFNLPNDILGQSLDYIYVKICDFLAFFGGDFNVPLKVPGLAVALWLVGVLAWPIIKPHFGKWVSTATTCAFMFLSMIMILSTPAEPMGVIICDTYRTVELTVGNSSFENGTVSPPNTLSLLSVFGKKIFVADIEKLPSSLQKGIKADYVVATGKYKGTIEELYKTFSPDCVVLHRSIRKKRENNLISEADSLEIPVHSIRKSGALHL